LSNSAVALWLQLLFLVGAVSIHCPSSRLLSKSSWPYPEEAPLEGQCLSGHILNQTWITKLVNSASSGSLQFHPLPNLVVILTVAHQSTPLPHHLSIAELPLTSKLDV
jgi:hypothetical protein